MVNSTNFMSKCSSVPMQQQGKFQKSSSCHSLLQTYAMLLWIFLFFDCVQAQSFDAALGEKNGVAAATYSFKVVTLTDRSGRYSDRMIQECKKIGMKPVCDHPSYCKNEGNALYIGQSNYLSHPSHRNYNSYNPSGFASIRNQWNGLCNYAASASSGRALCNIPSNTYNWKYPSNANPGFMCGCRGSGCAKTYAFKAVRLTDRTGRYSDRMIQECKKIGMKPVCDYPSYCQNDVNALYIGQLHHLSYKPHRDNNNYVPFGFASIRHQWNGLCSYTGSANGNSALCNIPYNSHSSQLPGNANPGFMCGWEGHLCLNTGEF